MSKWLITGAGGFLGETVTQQLTASGAHLTALKINREPTKAQAFDVAVSASTSLESLRDALGGKNFDYVINLAAAGVHPKDRDPKILEDINIALPASLVKLSKDMGNPAYIFAGSCSEYAEPTEAVNLSETAPLETEKLYGKTKAIGNKQALSLAEKHDVRALTARIFNLYGPGENEHRLVPSLLSGLIKGEKAQLSDGLQVRDFMHVGDASKNLIALAKALKTSELSPPQSVNICTGIGTSVRDVAIAACQSAGFSIDRLNFGAIQRRADDIAYLVGDPRKLKLHLSDHSFLNVRDGIQSYVQHLLTNASMRKAAPS